jgi:hypothetical protein
MSPRTYYNFTVTVDSASSGYQASASVTVLFSSSKIPTISISTPQKKYNPQQSIVLYATIGAVNSTISSWSSTQLSSTLLSAISQSPVSLVSKETKVPFGISIMPYALQPGLTYTFQLSSYYSFTSSAVASYATVSVVINSPPAGGSVTVNPNSGYALNTSYFVATASWQDDASDLPLNYVLAYYVLSASQLNVVKAISQAPFVYARFGQGLSQLLYSVTCVAIAVDSYGASANTSTSSYVYPIPTSLNLASTVSNGISSALNTGDYTSAAQLVQASSTSVRTVNCNMQTACGSLNRQVCQATARTCGPCLSGYVGLDGDANSACFSTSSGSSAKSSASSVAFMSRGPVDHTRRLTGSGTPGSGCTNNASCISGTCSNSICSEPQRSCKNSCSASTLGTCVFTNFYGETVNECSAADPFCRAQCHCVNGRYGNDCSLDTNAYTSAVNLVSVLCSNMVLIADGEDADEYTVVSRMTTISNIFEDETIPTQDAVVECASALMTYTLTPESWLCNAGTLASAFGAYDALIRAANYASRASGSSLSVTELMNAQLQLASSCQNFYIVDQDAIRSTGDFMRSSTSYATLASLDSSGSIFLPKTSFESVVINAHYWTTVLLNVDDFVSDNNNLQAAVGLQLMQRTLRFGAESMYENISSAPLSILLTSSTNFNISSLTTRRLSSSASSTLSVILQIPSLESIDYVNITAVSLDPVYCFESHTHSEYSINVSCPDKSVIVVNCPGKEVGRFDIVCHEIRTAPVCLLAMNSSNLRASNSDNCEVISYNTENVTCVCSIPAAAVYVATSARTSTSGVNVFTSVVQTYMPHQILYTAELVTSKTTYSLLSFVGLLTAVLLFGGFDMYRVARWKQRVVIAPATAAQLSTKFASQKSANPQMLTTASTKSLKLILDKSTKTGAVAGFNDPNIAGPKRIISEFLAGLMPTDVSTVDYSSISAFIRQHPLWYPQWHVLSDDSHTFALKSSKWISKVSKLLIILSLTAAMVPAIFGKDSDCSAIRKSGEACVQFSKMRGVVHTCKWDAEFQTCQFDAPTFARNSYYVLFAAIVVCIALLVEKVVVENLLNILFLVRQASANNRLDLDDQIKSKVVYRSGFLNASSKGQVVPDASSQRQGFSESGRSKSGKSEVESTPRSAMQLSKKLANSSVRFGENSPDDVVRSTAEDNLAVFVDGEDTVTNAHELKVHNDEFQFLQTYRTTLLRAVRLEKAYRLMDSLLPREELVSVLAQYIDNRATAAMGFVGQNMMYDNSENFVDFERFMRYFSPRKKDVNLSAFFDSQDVRNYHNPDLVFVSVSSSRTLKLLVNSERYIMNHIWQARVAASKHQAFMEAQLGKSMSEQEKYLMKLFIVDSLYGYKSTVGARMLLRNSDPGSGYVVSSHIVALLIRFGAFILLLGIYVFIIGSVIYANYYSLHYNLSSNLLIVSLLGIGTDVCIGQMLFVCVQDSWFVKPVLADIAYLIHELQQRGRLILMRRFGLVRGATSLIQHFNVACRLSRLFPHLPVARFLLSVHDYDVPIRYNRGVAVLTRSTVVDFYNNYHSSSSFSNNSTLFADLVVYSSLYSMFRYAPYQTQDVILELFTHVLVYGVIIGLYLLGEYNRTAVIVVVVVTSFLVLTWQFVASLLLQLALRWHLIFSDDQIERENQYFIQRNNLDEDKNYSRVVSASIKLKPVPALGEKNAINANISTNLSVLSTRSANSHHHKLTHQYTHTTKTSAAVLYQPGLSLMEGSLLDFSQDNMLGGGEDGNNEMLVMTGGRAGEYLNANTGDEYEAVSEMYGREHYQHSTHPMRHSPRLDYAASNANEDSKQQYLVQNTFTNSLSQYGNNGANNSSGNSILKLHSPLAGGSIAPSTAGDSKGKISVLTDDEAIMRTIMHNKYSNLNNLDSSEGNVSSGTIKNINTINNILVRGKHLNLPPIVGAPIGGPNVGLQDVGDNHSLSSINRDFSLRGRIPDIMRPVSAAQRPPSGNGGIRPGSALNRPSSSIGGSGSRSTSRPSSARPQSASQQPLRPSSARATRARHRPASGRSHDGQGIAGIATGITENTIEASHPILNPNYEDEEQASAGEVPRRKHRPHSNYRKRNVPSDQDGTAATAGATIRTNSPLYDDDDDNPYLSDHGHGTLLDAEEDPKVQSDREYEPTDQSARRNRRHRHHRHHHHSRTESTNIQLSDSSAPLAYGNAALPLVQAEEMVEGPGSHSKYARETELSVLGEDANDYIEYKPPDQIDLMQLASFGSISNGMPSNSGTLVRTESKDNFVLVNNETSPQNTNIEDVDV